MPASQLRLRPTRSARFVAQCTFVCLVFPASEMPAAAQIFGQRSLGRPLASRGSQGQTGMASPGGSVFGAPGLELGVRNPTDFIGRNLGERETFVGRVEGSAARTDAAAAAALRNSRAQEILRRRGQNANLQQIQQGTGNAGPVYAPRLAVGFSHPQIHSAQQDRRIEAASAAVLDTAPWQRVDVAARNGQVLLRGSVASPYERELAAAALLLEPGVESIDNRLQVRPR